MIFTGHFQHITDDTLNPAMIHPIRALLGRRPNNKRSDGEKDSRKDDLILFLEKESTTKG
jgi:hypothetical protein